ncbi:MAG: hypothetical protein CL916_01960 [Deltaproteobacteria bacterium]|nr:hypothetical protein [Deltaproteobacteria bacterium]
MNHNDPAKRVCQKINGDTSIELLLYVHTLNNGISVEQKHRLDGPTKPPVILVHGFAQNRFTWDCSTRSMTNYLASLGYDVWNVELPGHGRSKIPQNKSGDSFSSYVQALIDVAKYIEKPAFWIGHSLGGATVYAAASMIERSYLLGIIGLAALYHFGHNPITNIVCRITQKITSFPAINDIRIKTKHSGLLLSKLYGLTDVVGYTFPLSGWWPETVEPDLFEERMRLGMDWTNVQIWKEMSGWALQKRFPYADQWKKLDVPLLVALGDKDHLLTIRDGRPAYHESGSSDKEIIIFDDYHHETHFGHLDIILGKKAPKHVWPYLHNWMDSRLVSQS